MALRIAIPLLHRLMSQKIHDLFEIRSALSLSEAGHAPILLVRENFEPEQFRHYYQIPRESQLNIVSLPTPIQSRHLFSGRLLSWLLRNRGEYDLILTHEIEIAQFLTRFKKILKKPVVYEMHKPHHATMAPEPTLLEKKIFDQINGLIVTTQSLKKWVLENYNLSCPVEQIPLTSTIDPVSTQDVHKPYRIFFVGQPTRNRGVEILVQGLSQLTDCELHVIGGTPDQLTNFRVLIAENISPRIVFYGYVPQSQIREKLEGALAVVCPTLLTGSMPFVAMTKLYDYLGWGVPIVASNLPSIREVVTHEQEALLFHAGDTNSYVECIRRLIADNELRMSLRVNALKLAHDYTWEKRTQRLTLFLQRVLSSLQNDKATSIPSRNTILAP